MFKSLLRVLFFYFIFINAAISDKAACFLVMEGDKIITEDGDCRTRRPAMQTFFIPLSIIGYETSVLTSDSAPKLYYNDGKAKKECVDDKEVQMFGHAHSPKSWLKTGVVWYADALFEKITKAKLVASLKSIEYPGNYSALNSQSGYKLHQKLGAIDSIEISPLEQCKFLSAIQSQRKISEKTFKAFELIAKRGKLYQGWDMYAFSSGSEAIGWNVGWIKKKDKLLFYVEYIQDSDTYPIDGSVIAYHIAKTNLIKLVGLNKACLTSKDNV